MNKILLIEDEESIRGFLKINLKRNGYDVIEEGNGEDGLRTALAEKPIIVILDVMLPGIDGFEVCKLLRKKMKGLGIIILTAKTQDMDKIMGLEYGADDYMIKPFNPMELVLRVKSLIRRLLPDEEKTKIKDGLFEIDLYSQKIFKNNKELDITPKEYLLMKLFLQNPRKAFCRDELLDLVWGQDYYCDLKIIDVNIRRLRSKIEDNPSEPKFIETIWGKGYRWKGLD